MTRSKTFLGKAWPALGIHVPGCDPQLQELVLAELDDFQPTAIQESDDTSLLRAFFTTLALGGGIEVPTLDGPEAFKVPEGTQSGTVFRFRGKGMPDVSGRGKGDLFFKVQSVTPKKLNKEQRALLEQLSKVLPKDKFEPRPVDAEAEEKNIFEKVKDIFG